MPDLDLASLHARLAAYEWREILSCLRFAPRWPDNSTNPLYWEDRWRQRNPRQGAVMLLLVPRDDGLRVLLTERRAHLKDHAGELSLPGGHVEPDDASLQTAALRETYEEVGVPAQAIDVWGRLDGVYVPPSNFLVSAFTGLITDPDTIQPRPAEVESIVELPLTRLFDPTAIGRMKDAQDRDIDYYGWQQHRVWGATARLLNNLCEAVGQPCEPSHLR
ncbi:MAG TPA: CoA pyrophosphatase [Chloroflexota bacterium]|nr:CoA pyrophosphatase [Chloroflexota bacterium]